MMRYKNNPCNIRWSPRNDWRGQIEPLNGFCQFSDLEFGVRATLRLLENYRKKNLVTIGQIVSRFAPPKENATAAYIDFVVDSMNKSVYYEGFLFEEFFEKKYFADTVLCHVDEYALLVKHIAFIESRTDLEFKFICSLIKKFNLFKKLWKK